MEQVIYLDKSGPHPVEVSEDGSLRILRFGEEEKQSCVDLLAPHLLQLSYTRWMMTGLLIPPKIHKVLLCGLGGGAIAHFLLHHHPQVCIDIVEKDKRVIATARDFFSLPSIPQVQIFQDDIVDHLCTTPVEKLYDIIFVDIFDNASMAPPLFVPDFYRSLLDRLHHKGLLVTNLWNGDKIQYNTACQAIGESCNHQLVQMAVKKRSNAIILAFPSKIPQATLRKVRKKALVHQQRYQLPFHKYLKRLRRTNKIVRLIQGYT